MRRKVGRIWGVEEGEGREKEEPGKGMSKYWGEGEIGRVHNHLSSKRCVFF